MAVASLNTTVQLGGAGTPTTFTNEACTRITANTVYQVTDSTKRIFDPNTALTVQVDATGGGSWVTAGVATYTVDYMFGKVTFTSDQGGSALVRISGKYVSLTPLLEGTDFEVEDSIDLFETTVFGNTAKNRAAALASAQGSFTVLSLIGKHDYSSTSLRALMRAGTAVVLEYRPGGASGTTAYWRAWVYLSEGSEKAPLDGRIEGSMKFSTHAPLGTGENELAVPTWGGG